MRSSEFETYDVFTDQKFTGNQLAVFLNAEGLTDDEMQAITREFNLSETTFVFPPNDPAHTARIRIFTPAYEMPFAGHPTVGTSIAIARARKLTGELLLELNAGLFPVRLNMDGAVPHAEFQNPNLPEEIGAVPSTQLLEAAMALPAGSIEEGDARPRLIGAGANYVYARTQLDVVRNAKLNTAAFEALDLDNTVGVLLYAEGGEAADASFHARMFAPGANVPEDPATGSAAAALPGHLAASTRLADGAHRWIIEQGFEMGRPSRIFAQAEIKNGDVAAVRIGGAAVPVQRGQFFL